MAVLSWPRILVRLVPYAVFACFVLVLHQLTTSPQTVRIVNASGERLSNIEVVANGSSASFSNVGLGEARTLSYRSGWLEPRYAVHTQYEMGGEYSFALDDSTADSATFIIGRGDYNIYYQEPGVAVPRYEQGLLTEDARRSVYTERTKQVEGLSENSDTTLHIYIEDGAIRILEMIFRSKDSWWAETYYLYDDETLFASTHRDSSGPSRRSETYYFSPDGSFRYFTAASPSTDPQDRVEIDAAYEKEYFKRYLAAAKSPADTVQIDWINRE